MMLDLWQLSSDLKCKDIGDRVEAKLMDRTPPSRRLPQYRHEGHDSVHDQSDSGFDSALGDRKQAGYPHLEDRAPTAEEIKQYGKRKAKKIVKGAVVYEDGKKYDQSLWKAIFLALWKEYFTCSACMAVACMFYNTETLKLMTSWTSNHGSSSHKSDHPRDDPSS